MPALILQPLVENAIKYGVSRSQRPVTVTIAAEAIGDLGLSLVFIGMCFRSTELAILAYISDPAKREAAIEKLRQKERAKRPWISHLMNAGWVCLLAGVAGQLSNIF